jgi:hypothetical protein
MNDEKMRRAAGFEKSKMLRSRLDEALLSGGAQAATTARDMARLSAEAEARSTRLETAVMRFLAAKRAPLEKAEAERLSLRVESVRLRSAYAVRILVLNVFHVLGAIALVIWRIRRVLAVLALIITVAWLCMRYGPPAIAALRAFAERYLQ